MRLRNYPDSAKRAVPTGGRHAAKAEAAAAAKSIDEALWTAAEARATVLEEYPTDEIIEILSATAQAWLQPHYGPRRRLLEELPERLKVAKPMLEHGLDAIFSAVDAKRMGMMVAAEAENPLALDRPVQRPDGQFARLAGPRLIVHALAGNIPGLAIPHIVSALLARSICMLRESSRQPLLTDAFLDTLAEYSVDLATMVVPIGWSAGQTAIESHVFDQAGRLEISGSDATVRAIADRNPDRTFVERGTRISAGLIAARADTDAWATGFAQDITMFDGQGCLTPHVILVEGSHLRARRFAQLMAIALERLERLWPREVRDLAAETERRAFIDQAEVASALDRARWLKRGRDDAWVVYFNPEGRVTLGPGLRCVTVVPVANRQFTENALREARFPLAGVGLGLAEDEEEFEETVTRLCQLGATLVCPPGQMHRPPIDWPQDGRARLGDLLSWHREDEL